MSKASDRAYDAIRGMILSGELSSGDPLREEALAQACGVSRTPIREALRQLEVDLLVRRTESQRSYVADWSLDDVADAFELRAMLEGHAARRAAERITDDIVDELKHYNKAIFAAISKPRPDVPTFLDRNREFHALVLDTAGSPRLKNLLTALIEQPVVWRTAHNYDPTAFQNSHSEHADLISAFERRDGPWAESIMAGHIRRAFHAYCDAHKGMGALKKGAA
ncbi:GntR family transcriptional regulator [Erythrobacter longus]|uniref:GntR family transcriptional regulator n=1 Tax=Erythrobacter longus TaxID=1044 RepID=A0A074MGU9_ERYLO|nr:GntR family transcriptional regulator [Erythrobacter longus]KEO92055.1 GntR family transcriptional regulator [Erythrobacter longus]